MKNTITSLILLLFIFSCNQPINYIDLEERILKILKTEGNLLAKIDNGTTLFGPRLILSLLAFG